MHDRLYDLSGYEKIDIDCSNLKRKSEEIEKEIGSKLIIIKFL